MKKSLSILLFFISVFAFGQNNHFDQLTLRTPQFATPDSVITYVDSYFQGTGGFVSGTGVRSSATDTTITTRLTSLWNIPFGNQSLSGSGTWHSASTFNAYTNNNTLHAVIFGGILNDTRRGGFSDATMRKIIGNLNIAFVNQFSKSNVNAGSGSGTIARYGTWTTTVPVSTFGGKAVAAGASTSTLNDSITYTFTDTTYYVRLVGSDGITNIYNPFSAYLDNVLVYNGTENLMTDGISDGVYDNKRSPFALIFTGLSNSTHVLKLVNTGVGNLFVVDGFGHLMASANARPLMIFEAPYLDVTGFATSPSSGSVGAISAANAKVDSLISTWNQNYPAYAIKPYQYLDTLSGISSADHIHPSATGDAPQLTTAFLSVIPSLTTTIPSNTITSDYSRVNVNIGGRKEKLAFISDIQSVIQPNSIPINSLVKYSGKYFVGSNIYNSGAFNGVGQAAPLYPWDIAGIGSSQLHIGNSTNDAGGYLFTTSGNALAILAGDSYNGANYIAKATDATNLQLGSSAGQLSFYANTGLTIGNSFTPTEIFRFNSTALSTAAKISTGVVGTANYQLESNPSTNASQFHVGNGTDVGLYGEVNAFNNASIANYSFNSTNWIAKGTTGVAMYINGQAFEVYSSGSLVAGNTFTPSLLMHIHPTSWTVLNTALPSGNTADSLLQIASSGGTATIKAIKFPTLDAVTASGAATTNAITTGSITLGTAGNSLNITEGSNGRVGQTTLVSGTKAITITGLTTSSRAFVTLVTPNTVTSTVNYQAVCTSNTLTIQANVAAGTINTADISTINYFVIN